MKIARKVEVEVEPTTDECWNAVLELGPLDQLRFCRLLANALQPQEDALRKILELVDTEAFLEAEVSITRLANCMCRVREKRNKEVV